uniref:Reverse transcriptase domain-containing protein n=1 Tax=Tanacetum cinerariifolium TaxID=118510 RepID=A0A6L2L0Z7_TANCI|nr:reverse transcriptase domain-containing protein [Tanacetum cinerariifolium]
MTGLDVIATSIRNSPTKTSTIEELLAKLLGILGLENSTSDNSNPPSKVTNSSTVHPTAFYTSPNTGGSLYYPNVHPTIMQQHMSSVSTLGHPRGFGYHVTQHKTTLLCSRSNLGLLLPLSGRWDPRSPRDKRPHFRMLLLSGRFIIPPQHGGSLPVTAPSPIPHAFLVSQHTWHQRLGNPGGEVMRRLVSSNFISCNKEKPLVLCHACQLGKHVMLPFVSSDTMISSCFEIIHSDVWTSPISSLLGFKYYVLFLDHYSQAHIVNCNPSRTPIDTESKLGSDGDPISDPTLYQSIAGSLQYLTFNRPDISYVVQQVCLHMRDPQEPHFSALKWILCAEAEYRVVAETCWFLNLLHELHTHLSSATLVYCDNKIYDKDPTEIHGIKQKPYEGIQAFMDCFKVKSAHIKGVPLVLRISAFMHGHSHPKIAKKLNDKISKIVNEMWESVRAFIRGETSADIIKVIRSPRWEKSAGERLVPTSSKSSDLLDGKRLLEILAIDNVNFPAPPLMVGTPEKRNMNKFCDYHQDRGKAAKRERAQPKEKKRLSAWLQGQKVYVDGGSYSKIMYEHCFRNLSYRTRSRLRESHNPLVGFSREVNYPLGVIDLEVTIGKCGRNQTVIMEFAVVKSLSSYNALLDMTGIPRAITEHSLDTYPHNEPKVQKKRSLAPDKRKVVTDKVNEWLKVGIVRRVRYPSWVVNPVLVKKDEEKMAFHTKEGVFCYTEMPFGLKNARETYQRLVDSAFKERIGTEATEAAFFEIKKLVSKLPTLTTPKKGKTLMMYLAASNEAVSAVLLTKRDGRQMLIHYVITDSPIGQVLNNSGVSGRSTGWATDSHRDAVKDIHAFMDSKLVASQVEGSYEAKGERMIKHQEKVLQLAGAFNGFRITHILRAENRKADALSKLAAVQFDHLSKEVLVEVLNERSVEAQEAKPLANITEVGRKLKIQLISTLDYHPHGNGAMKRANRSLLRGIKTRLKKGGSAWAGEVPNVLWAHQTMKKTINGETPFSLTYGTKVVIPVEIGMPTHRTSNLNEKTNDQELRLNLDLLEERREIVAIMEARYKQQVEKYYNKKVRHVQFKVGEFVLRKMKHQGMLTHAS